MHRTAIEATCKASAARIINVLEAGASPKVVGEVAVIGGGGNDRWGAGGGGWRR